MNATPGGYCAPAGPQPSGWCMSAYGQSLMEWYCCNTEDCAGYNFSSVTGSGCLFKDVQGGFVAASSDVTGYTKQGFVQPSGPAAAITVNFADVGLFPGSVIRVYGIWEGQVLAESNSSSFTAPAVPWQGTAFLRLSTVG